MQLPFYTLLALATATSLVSADYFANFFTDEHCTQDGSIGFDMTNPGCFAWRGAHSVYIPKTILDGTVTSYRFISGSCGSDTCRK
ncbi:hypothetical protein I302_102702 [Kwoniella bestiolae CBS 10118]|uniref:Uncharacterized protein n=1 Tax=Kwoniella bestiolae CBS 10118 TaxID=1296100 RepID=A0AAJ8K428_9TREE